MKIVVTGMVGIDKKSYLQKVCDYAGSKGKKILLCNVGDMMYAEAPDVSPGRILDIPIKRLSSLRRSVFKDIIAKSKKASNLIVNTHATFRWRHGLFPAVDFDQMRQLDADIYINLIDGVAALHHRLESEHAMQHTLKDLIVWREEEMIGTEMLCKGLGEDVPFYSLARGTKKETIETFYKLVFEPQREKTYLSFPMTNVADIPNVQSYIDDFREKMKEYFICFDPAQLEEAYLPQKAKKALTFLRGLRFPSLINTEEAFHKRLAGLHLAKGVSINAPENFETNSYSLEITFADGMDLRKKMDALYKTEGLEKLGDPWRHIS